MKQKIIYNVTIFVEYDEQEMLKEPKIICERQFDTIAGAIQFTMAETDKWWHEFFQQICFIIEILNLDNRKQGIVFDNIGLQYYCDGIATEIDYDSDKCEEDDEYFPKLSEEYIKDLIGTAHSV